MLQIEASERRPPRFLQHSLSFMLQTAEFLLQKQVAEALSLRLGPLPPRYLQQSKTPEPSRILRLQHIYLHLQQNDLSAPVGEVVLLQVDRKLQHIYLSEAARKVSGRRVAVDLQQIKDDLQHIKVELLPIPLELQ